MQKTTNLLKEIRITQNMKTDNELEDNVVAENEEELPHKDIEDPGFDSIDDATEEDDYDDFEYDDEEYPDEGIPEGDGYELNEIDEHELEMAEEDIDNNDQFRKEKKLLVDETPVKFKTHSTDELIQKMHKQCKKISEILAITHDDAVNLLHYFSWNSDKLMEEYMTDTEETRKKAGLIWKKDTLIGTKTKYPEGTEPLECFICCEEKTETYKLACNHEYCLECYSRYVEERLSGGKVIKCPDCDLALQTRDIDNICGEGSSVKLLESSIKEYIERLPAFKWCPAPDCTGIVEVQNFGDLKSIIQKCKIPVVKCDQNHQFCVYCSFENHSPAPCQITKNWVTKCKDDSETVKWIMSNTKTCPRCESSIEKNGGCNHMTCKKCRHEFCWICMGDWKKHGSQYYNCNRFEEKKEESVKKESIKATKESLQRYLHYYNLFSIHEVSTKLDTKRCLVVEETVRELQEASGISWIQAQFIVDSANILLNSRRTLKWSYPLAYYCDRKPYLNIFENVQNELSLAVESLSKLFEIEDPNETVERRKEFIDACGVVIQRQNAILSCMQELLETKTLPEDALVIKKGITPT